VNGFDVPKPALKFEHFGFDEALMKAIRKQGFEEPTPIQKQAVPGLLLFCVKE